MYLTYEKHKIHLSLKLLRLIDGISLNDISIELNVPKNKITKIESSFGEIEREFLANYIDYLDDDITIDLTKSKKILNKLNEFLDIFFRDDVYPAINYFQENLLDIKNIPIFVYSDYILCLSFYFQLISEAKDYLSDALEKCYDLLFNDQLNLYHIKKTGVYILNHKYKKALESINKVDLINGSKHYLYYLKAELNIVNLDVKESIIYYLKSLNHSNELLSNSRLIATKAGLATNYGLQNNFIQCISTFEDVYYGLENRMDYKAKMIRSKYLYHMILCKRYDAINKKLIQDCLIIDSELNLRPSINLIINGLGYLFINDIQNFNKICKKIQENDDPTSKHNYDFLQNIINNHSQKRTITRLSNLYMTMGDLINYQIVRSQYLQIHDNYQLLNKS